MIKKINLSITILSVVEAICYFTPFCISREYWKFQKSITYHGVAVLESCSNVSIFEVGGILGPVPAIILFFVALATAIVYFLRALDYTWPICRKGWIVSVVHLISMVVFLLYTCIVATVEEISYEYTYSIGWMFFVIIALNVISTALAIFLKRSPIAITEIKEKQQAAENSINSLDELLAYKELLDSGILTKEEFEEKKKQLLND